MNKKPAILLILAAILIAYLCIHLASVPARVNSSPADTAFSVSQAYRYLQQIAKAPHSMGTPENERVRAYIASTCQQLGLDTAIRNSTSVISWSHGVSAGNVYNIIARLKGVHSSKTIIVAAHYDSQPNAPGAGDDGASCAAMLETARILKAGRPLENDIIFLFTDGEEAGLLGANAFVQEDPLLKETGVVLNFDNRGSSGTLSMFETNSDNGWVVREYARSVAHANAASLSYEIYKTLPNNTDYTMFKRAGIAGLNNAFIDGFVDYHSMTDRPENLDLNTFQEQGDDMLSLVKHFGGLDIRETKAPDITFFNIIGNWMIDYPASLNLLFLILTNILLIAGLATGLVRRQVRMRGFIAGIVAFPVVLALLYFISRWTLQGIRSAAPLYDGYYDNAYNTCYYFFALSALGIALFTFCYQWLLRKFTMPSLLAGIVLLEVIAVDFLYTVIPTAIYFLCFPLLFFLITGLFLFRNEADASDRPWRSRLITLAFLLPAILLLAPVISSLFVAFGVSSMTAYVVVALGLLLGLFVPLLAAAFRESRWLIPGGAFALFLLGILLAFMRGGYTSQQPYKTNLRYLVNADEGKACWVSDAEQPDAWNRRFFPRARIGHVIGGTDRELINEAPLLPLDSPTLTVLRDTIDNGVRKLTLHCRAIAGAVSVHMDLDKKDPALNILVDGKLAAQNSGKKHAYTWLDYQGVTNEGFDVLFELEPAKPFGIDLLSRSMGLPALQGFHGYPPGIIPGPGDNSNTTVVARHYTF